MYCYHGIYVYYRYIGMCVYNVVVMCVMGVTVSLVLQSQITIAYVFSAVSIIFCATGALLLLYVPKVSVNVLYGIWFSPNHFK